MIGIKDLHYSTKIKRDVEDQLYWSLLSGLLFEVKGPFAFSKQNNKTQVKKKKTC